MITDAWVMAAMIRSEPRRHRGHVAISRSNTRPIQPRRVFRPASTAAPRGLRLAPAGSLPSGAPRCGGRRTRHEASPRRQTGRLQLGLKPPAGSDAAAEVVEGIPLGCQRRVTSSTGLAWSHCFSSPLHFLSYNFHHCHFLFSFVKFQCATRFQSINRRFPHQEPCPRHRRVPLNYRGFVKCQNDAPRLLQPRPGILLKSRHSRVCLASRQRCTTAVFWWNPIDLC